MKLNSIKISNYKSLKQEKIEFGKFNIIVGANASGKSNLISVINFFKNIMENGLNNAISMQGGVDYVRNINIGAKENLSIVLHLDSKDKPIKALGISDDSKNDDKFTIYINEIYYELSLEFFKKKIGYKSVFEKFKIKCSFLNESKKKDKIDGEIIFSNNNGKVDLSVNPSDIILIKEGLSLTPEAKQELEENLSNKKLLVELDIFFKMPTLVFPYVVRDFFKNVSMYDLDPKLSKRAVTITGKTELESDGGNLAIVLKNILDDNKTKEKFLLLISDILPFVEKLSVDDSIDKSVILSLKEIFSKKMYPASSMSDGTINITALIIALYFESNKSLILIEEPERNIHPHLISKLIEMMKDVSENLNKQIIITTHNPELLRHAGIDNILLVHRDNEGFSKVSKPSEMEEVKIFLKNNMDINDIYVENLLEW
ncbi:MAG: AAA family ATPase [Spirochaetes bacterium]|nr:AAA family ATPase [Spirochaetota bacterium]